MVLRIDQPWLADPPDGLCVRVNADSSIDVIEEETIVLETWNGFDLGGPSVSVVVGFSLGVASPQLAAYWNAQNPVRWDDPNADPFADLHAAMAQVNETRRIPRRKPEPTPAAICMQALAEGGGDHPIFGLEEIVDTMMALSITADGFTYLAARCGNDPENVRAVVFAVYQGTLSIEKVKAGPFDDATPVDLEIDRCRLELEQAGAC